MVLAKDRESVFKCGIAKAPASSWFYTASITTERQNGLPTPDDNLRGYLEGDLNSQVEGMRGKEFLLIHGNADINANYQHSMKLSRALQKAGILFTVMVSLKIEIRN
jgi:dipeptidyl-peptidase-4